MIAYEIICILFCGSLFAGFLGSLSGLGGGLIIVPLIVLGLNVDIHYAIGASLIAVIATSSGASAAYVKEGYTNIRVGMFLETATTIGALSGVFIGLLLPAYALSLIFGFILLYCACSSFFSIDVDHLALPTDKLAAIFKLDSTCPPNSQVYHVQHVPLGYAIMFVAGALSGILGIGSGVLKVLALDRVMQLPFKVSTTTSNFMIGVTAATSAGLYLHLGYIDPLLAMPVMMGVVVGSFFGARLLPHIRTKRLKSLFGCLMIIIAVQMIYKSLGSG